MMNTSNKKETPTGPKTSRAEETLLLKARRWIPQPWMVLCVLAISAALTIIGRTLIQANSAPDVSQQASELMEASKDEPTVAPAPTITTNAMSPTVSAPTIGESILERKSKP